MRFSTLVGLLTAGNAAAEVLKVGDFAQGAEFTKCIKITDFNAKSLADEVEVTDRAAEGGCCPEGYIPGIKHYNNYWGSMVICGFKDDGSIALSSSSSNGAKTCTYNKCYVVKMDITCADESKMTLDGCCPKGQYTTDCKSYVKSASFFSEKVGYCLSYQKKYKLEGTTEKTDDQVTVDGVTSLSLTNLKAYTVCPGGWGSGSATAAAPAATTGSSPAPEPAPAPASAPAASSGGAVTTSKYKFADAEQGAAFDKCIKISDFNTKTLDDEVDVADREEGGCCPNGFVPGAKYYTSYQGAQVVCGFKADGTTAMSTGSSNGKKTCTYNSCYVQKQGLACKEDTKQLLNGCCGATAKARTFKDGCMNYDYTLKTVYQNSYEYCLSYDKDYGTKGWSGTAEATDDQKDASLWLRTSTHTLLAKVAQLAVVAVTQQPQAVQFAWQQVCSLPS